MTPQLSDQEVLEACIRKATDAGWRPPFEEPILSFTVTQDDVEGTYQTEPYIRFELDGTHDWCVGIDKVIFSIDFAKALWSKSAIDMSQELEWKSDIPSIFIPKWAFHIQQLAIAPDRIAYLREHALNERMNNE